MLRSPGKGCKAGRAGAPSAGEGEPPEAVGRALPTGPELHPKCSGKVSRRKGQDLFHFRMILSVGTLNVNTEVFTWTWL